MNPPIRIEIPTPSYMDPVNVFLFTEPEPVLIDAGMKGPNAWETLVDALEKHGTSVKDLKKVIITHPHGDHIGYAAKIARESQAEIWLNEFSYPYVVDLENTWMKRYQIFQDTFAPQSKEGINDPRIQIFKGVIKSFADDWEYIPEDRIKTYKVGDDLEFGNLKWRVLYAPGHTNTQTCFYNDETGWLLAADALLPLVPAATVEPMINNPDKRSVNLPVMIEFLEDLKEMEFSNVYPGHLEITESHKTLISRQLERIEQRVDQCYDLIKSGKHTYFELFDVLYKNPYNIMGMAMLIGYLDILETRGLVQLERTKEGMIKYFKS